jgi:hypothetical protein
MLMDLSETSVDQQEMGHRSGHFNGKIMGISGKRRFNWGKQGYLILITN